MKSESAHQKKSSSLKSSKKSFDTVKLFRKIKTELSKKLWAMTPEERTAYFAQIPDFIGGKSK